MWRYCGSPLLLSVLCSPLHSLGDSVPCASVLVWLLFLVQKELSTHLCKKQDGNVSAQIVSGTSTELGQKTEDQPLISAFWLTAQLKWVGPMQGVRENFACIGNQIYQTCIILVILVVILKLCVIYWVSKVCTHTAGFRLHAEFNPLTYIFSWCKGDLRHLLEARAWQQCQWCQQWATPALSHMGATYGF